MQMFNLGNAKEVVTLGEHRPWEEEERFGAELLDGPRATEFRGIAARANYLAQDRPDLQFSVKEICRTMSNPSVHDRRKVKRLARYLKGNSRLIYLYNWQEPTSDLNGYSDSDWAGCRRTAKSTSGGALCVGSHLVKSWSATQKNITLSSAEAELVAAVRTCSEALGLAQLPYDWEMPMTAKIFVDSSAAIGVASRKGSGKLRHVRVGDLWIQELVEEEEVMLRKIQGSQNIADAFTKDLSQKTMNEHLHRMNTELRQGRAASGLQLQQDARQVR